MRVLITIALCVIVYGCFGQPQFEGIKKINGANLFIRIEGKGDYLIIVHGGPGLNHSYFRPYLDQLKKDYTLVYYDQRACGQSEIPSTDSISMKFFVEDIEAIRKSLSTEKVNILAHSWGSIPVANYCKTYPSRINKVIFSNPSPLNKEYDITMMQYLASHMTSDDSVRRANIMAARDYSVEGMTALMKINFRASTYNRENIDKLNLNLPENFGQASGALFTGLGKDLASYDLYEDTKKFNFPVLIIYGAADGIPRASIDRLKQAIPSSKTVGFKKSGHFPFLEEPGRYAAVVRKFLK